MESKKQISAISFGKSDGKNEARQPNFESLFYDGSGDYEKLKNDPLKYLIVGRKGTGKTILARYFMKKMQEEKHTYAKFIVAGDFTGEKLKNFNYNVIREEEREIFWRYLILNELTKMLVEHENGLLSRKWIGKLKDIGTNLMFNLEEMVQENVVNSNFGGSVSNHGFSVGGNSSLESKNSKKLKPATYFDQADKMMETLLKVMTRVKNKYFLFFDDLDEIKIGSLQRDSDESNMTLLSDSLYDFVVALAYINDKLLDAGSKSRVISTMRQDIVDQMQRKTKNFNKVLTDNGIKISWFSPMIKETPQNTALGKLVLHKIKVSIDSYHDMNNKALFNTVFTQAKPQKRPFSFIVNRGFGRPRDVIEYLNLIQEKFPTAESINFHMVTQVQSEYCSWFYDELQNEISILGRSEDIFNTLELIKKNGQGIFKYKTLKINLEKGDKEVKVLGLKDDLKALFKLGAIGNYHKEKGSRTATVEYSYREGTDNPDFSKEFIIHPAVQNFLSIK
ncbi:hypothetical protein U0Q88_004530 [Lactiplantibacillus plantarum]|uniref:P-loop ATPase, Sll1717 family n=1 Tax=Lactiplantibacillus plantarum TaxID=1590 RepID=UPI002ED3BB26|nr:hypothetical protein [Lactiplantibacillus plantarum]